MMLRFLGWKEAADILSSAFAKTINDGKLTGDLASQVEGTKPLSCSEFATALLGNI
jgi:isocitrate dehydrogenase